MKSSAPSGNAPRTNLSQRYLGSGGGGAGGSVGGTSTRPREDSSSAADTLQQSTTTSTSDWNQTGSTPAGFRDPLFRPKSGMSLTPAAGTITTPGSASHDDSGRKEKRQQRNTTPREDRRGTEVYYEADAETFGAPLQMLSRAGGGGGSPHLQQGFQNSSGMESTSHTAFSQQQQQQQQSSGSRGTNVSHNQSNTIGSYGQQQQQQQMPYRNVETSLPFASTPAAIEESNQSNALLKRHKAVLEATLAEVESLHEVIEGLEKTVETLRKEKQQLQSQVEFRQKEEARLQKEIERLNETCSVLSSTIHKTGQDYAATISTMQSKHRETESSLRTQLEKVSAQLVSTQHPISSLRPLPWQKLSGMEGHPAHLLRRALLVDWKREEYFHRNIPMYSNDDADDEDAVVKLGCVTTVKPSILASTSAATGGAAVTAADGTTTAAELYSKGATRHIADDELDWINTTAEEQKNSKDLEIWRRVCARVYQILMDRRNVMHTHVVENSPIEFLLRTRQQVLSEMLSLQGDVRRALVVLHTVGQKLLTVGTFGTFLGQSIREGSLSGENMQPGMKLSEVLSSHVTNFAVHLQTSVETQVELVQSMLTDMDSAIQRVKRASLTDIDRRLLLPNDDGSPRGAALRDELETAVDKDDDTYTPTKGRTDNSNNNTGGAQRSSTKKGSERKGGSKGQRSRSANLR